MHSRIFFALPAALALIACGSGSDGGSSSPSESTQPTTALYAELGPTTGTVDLPSSTDVPITGFIFTNDGTADVTLSHFQVTYSSGETAPTTDDLGIVVAAGGATHAIGYIFDAARPRVVSRLSLTIAGTTERLSITTTNRTGPLPRPAAR